LPPPELNPLLNPLLADNMGRWAQVYFTSPPEKREQAVQELVRELEAEKSTRAGASSPVIPHPVPAPVKEQRPETILAPPDPRPEIQPAFLECRSCGKKNPPSQRFCGMCGTRLEEQGAVRDETQKGEPVAHDTVANSRSADFQSEEHPALDPQENSHQYLQKDNLQQEQEKGLQHGPWQRQEQQQRQVWREGLQGEEIRREGLQRESHAEDPHEDRHLEKLPEPHPAPSMRSHELQYFAPRRDAYESRGPTNELSLFQTGREDYDDAPRALGSVRMYIAILLVLVVSILAYLAWRNAQGTARNSKPPASYAAPDEPVTPDSVAANAPKSNTPDAASATGNGANPSGSAAESTRSPSAPANRDLNQPALKKPNPHPDEAETTPPSPPKNAAAEPLAGPGAGAEELTVAQDYLNGTNGQSRNTAEAAKWLWKAIAKHNSDATFLLSELYLKGDGVPKNCDQARVLLDAATLKGVKGAGERLRHLQAFGCQ